MDGNRIVLRDEPDGTGSDSNDSEDDDSVVVVRAGSRGPCVESTAADFLFRDSYFDDRDLGRAGPGDYTTRSMRPMPSPVPRSHSYLSCVPYEVHSPKSTIRGRCRLSDFCRGHAPL